MEVTCLMATGVEHRRAAKPRAGVTLLEVLVACGILVIGLASIASILPAAGVRLGQANLEDRAGTAAANAYADIVTRGLVSSDIFSSGTMQSAAFGATLPLLAVPPLASARFVINSTTVSVMQSRLDITRSLTLEDDLVYKPALLGDTPNSSFFSNTSPREYRAGVRWGALLAPDSLPAVAGGIATLSIATFRKAGTLGEFVLTATGPGSSMFRITSGNPAADEALRKQFFSGCGYVLALPTAANMTPKWIKITSSWTVNGVGPAYVVLDLFPLGAATAGLMTNGTSITVVAFENLLRVDQYPVALD